MPGYYIIDTNSIAATSAGLVVVRGVTATEFIALPIGQVRHIYNDGANVRFVNLPDPGTWYDYAGTSVPTWITTCSKPPFLLCDGSGFSGTTYPVLAGILGGTTLPDFRGRNPFFLNGGTGRLTTAGAGIDGNTLFAVGGNNGVTLAANQIPSGVTATNAAQAIAVTSAISLPIGAVIVSDPGTGGTASRYGAGTLGTVNSSGNNSISVTTVNASQAVVPSTAPGIVAGIRMIRAA